MIAVEQIERARALHDVNRERERQDAKWGEQKHDLCTWVTILTEEVGELAQAVLHDTFGGPHAEEVRMEAIHVAAVAVQISEYLDRQGRGPE